MEAQQIHIKDGKKEFFIQPNDILFVKADGNYCDIYLTENTVYNTVRIQIGELWKMICEVCTATCSLLRVGRSHIINLKYLQFADPQKRTITLFKDKAVVLDGVSRDAIKDLLVRLSREQRKEVLQPFSQRMKLSVPVAELNEEHPTVDGREYVDLGLPSGTLWAVLHLDARRPEDYGHYTYFRKREAYLSQKEWRVPTDSEFQELRDNCLITWCSTQRGEKGVLFIGPNGNKLFFIASGYRRDTDAVREFRICASFWVAPEDHGSRLGEIWMTENEEATDIFESVDIMGSSGGLSPIEFELPVRFVHSPVEIKTDESKK